ncbi:hypothetical protein [Arachnia propionica]|uniref:Lipoprotein n=1 Tax=Arachnia propionica TaxID=1750 RepID=A0A3P1WVH6_9ACTN|nr:hypothetical protein [Arachnia propionica]RRD49420.1 hypothetical protein EII35_08630 [Arachnia propionica]
MRIHALVALGAVLALSACQSDAAALLDVLRRESISKTDWEGLAVVSTEESRPDKDKPGQPHVTRCFSLEVDGDTAVSQVLATARSEGWTEQADLSTPNTVVAHKSHGSDTLVLLVDAHADECPGPGLRVTLTYQ